MLFFPMATDTLLPLCKLDRGFPNLHPIGTDGFSNGCLGRSRGANGCHIRREEGNQDIVLPGDTWYGILGIAILIAVRACG